MNRRSYMTPRALLLRALPLATLATGCYFLPTDEYPCSSDADCAGLPRSICDVEKNVCTNTTIVTILPWLQDGGLQTVVDSGVVVIIKDGGPPLPDAATSDDASIPDAATNPDGAVITDAAVAGDAALSDAGVVDLDGGTTDAATSDAAVGTDAGVDFDAAVGVDRYLPPGNRAPVAYGGALLTTPGVTGTGTLRAEDPDGNAITYVLLDPIPEGLTLLDASTGLYSFTSNTSGALTFRFRATDGQLTSNEALVEVRVVGDSLRSRTWVGGDGSNPRGWAVANNWSPPQIPDTNDDVLIPDTTNDPLVSANAVVHSIYVLAGAEIEVGGTAELNAKGDVMAGGLTRGTGKLVMEPPANAPSKAFGTFGNLDIRANAGTLGPVLADTLRVAGAQWFGQQVQFTVGGQRIEVTRTLTTENGGTLVMTSPLDYVVVGGKATFNGNSQGVLTNGVLELRNDLDILGGTAFTASDEHKVLLTGSSQTLRMSGGGTNNWSAHLQDLEVQSTLGVTFTSVNGDNSEHVIMGNLDVTSPTVTLRGSQTVRVLGDLVTVEQSTVDLAGIVLTATTGTELVAGAFTPDTVTFAATTEATMKSGLGYQAVRALGPVLVADGSTMDALSLQATTAVVRLEGNATVNGNVSVELGELVVDGADDVTVSGSFTTVYNVSGGGTLRMEGGELDVTGAVTFGGGNTNNKLIGGTLRARGAFDATTSGAFTAGGEHTVILEGAAAQTVRFTGGGVNTWQNHFQHLQVLSGGNLTFTPYNSDTGETVIMGNLDVDTAVTLTGSQPLRVVGTLDTVSGSTIDNNAILLGGQSGTSLVAGDFTPNTVTFLSSGGDAPAKAGLGYRTVIVQGTVTFGDGATMSTLTLNTSTAIARFAGVATVNGNVSVDLGEVVVDGTDGVTVTGSFTTVYNVSGGGTLRMEGGELDVTGAVTFGGGSTNNKLIGGTLRARGAFDATTSGAFTAGGEHTVILEGAAAQTVRFTGGGVNTWQNHFQHLQVLSGGNLTFTPYNSDTGETVIMGNLDVDTAVTLTGSQPLRVVGTLDTVSGSTIDNNAILLGGQSGTSLVAGDFTPNTVTFLSSGGDAPAKAGLGYRTVIVQGTVTFGDGATMSTLTLNTSTAIARFAGVATVNGNVSVDLGEVVVDGTDGVTVTGSFTTVYNVSGGGTLRMEGGELDVTGAVTFGGGSTNNKLSGGTLRARGAFDATTSGAFTAGGEHTVILEGAAAQTVRFTGGGVNTWQNHFQHLQVLSGGNVTFTPYNNDTGETVVMGNLDVASDGHDVLGGQPVRVVGEVSSAATTTIRLSRILLGGVMGTTLVAGTFTPTEAHFVNTVEATLDSALGYRTVVVLGPVQVENGTTMENLTLNSGAAAVRPQGRMDVNGTVTITRGELFIDVGDDVRVSGTFTTAYDFSGGGTLNMQGGSLTVVGNMTFGGGSTQGKLTAGTIHAKSGFDVTAGSAFSASGSHVVILDGASTQQVRFSSGGTFNYNNHFQELEVRSGSTVTFAPYNSDTGNVVALGNMDVDTAVTLSQPLQVSGALLVEATGNVGFSRNTTVGTDLDLYGTATVSNATIIINNTLYQRDTSTLTVNAGGTVNVGGGCSRSAGYSQTGTVNGPGCS
ncbi:MAG: hypothetical protein AB2A00_03135 [Myxococcota bacterium]